MSISISESANRRLLAASPAVRSVFYELIGYEEGRLKANRFRHADGVHRSGYDHYVGAYHPRTAEAILDEAERVAVERQRWADSPDGRYCAAIHRAEDLIYAASPTFELLHGARNRGWCNPLNRKAAAVTLDEADALLRRLSLQVAAARSALESLPPTPPVGQSMERAA